MHKHKLESSTDSHQQKCVVIFPLTWDVVINAQICVENGGISGNLFNLLGTHNVPEGV
jgi:hypothetical protein